MEKSKVNRTSLRKLLKEDIGSVFEHEAEIANRHRTRLTTAFEYNRSICTVSLENDRHRPLSGSQDRHVASVTPDAEYLFNMTSWDRREFLCRRQIR